jgi:putative ABC transport system permease protein
MIDFRMAGRNLRRYPASCAIAVLSLAGGIGATTATLVIRDAVFVKPPPLYRSADELSRVQIGSPENPIRPIGNAVPGPLVANWRGSSLGATLAAAGPARVLDVRTASRTDTAPVRPVSRELFSVLGVGAALGQTLSDLPAEPSGPRPAVMSYRLWQTLLNGRADAIGSTIWLGGDPHVVIGVMPQRFWFSSMDSPVWTLLEPGSLLSADGEFEVVGRRAAGVTHEGLARQLEAGLRDYASRLPVGRRECQVHVSGVGGTPVGHMMALFVPWLLGASVVLTLLIACANVAMLVIAQWTAREQEIAIRASLGASRGRIVRGLLTESIMMALLGGVLGVCATYALRGVIFRNAGETAILFDLSIDPRVLILSAVIAILSGVLAGIGPALIETRRLHGNPMRTIGSSERVRQRWRHTLVVLETTATVALLVVSTTMLTSYRRHFTIDRGFRTEPLAALRVSHAAGVPAQELLDLLKRTPGVASAAASTTIPYAAFGGRHPVATDAAGSQAFQAEGGSVSPEFFATLGVPIRAGRMFTAAESPESRTAIVSQTLARRLFGNRDPIGLRLWIREQPHEIVGVVPDYMNASFQSPERAAKVFVPLALKGAERREVPFLIRATSDPAALVETLRRTLQEAGPGTVVGRAFTIDGVIAGAGGEMLVGTAPLLPLVATGLLLTSVGIYGVLAFAVTRRSKELALRVAMGATRADLVRVVAGHSMRLVLVGTACGIAATFVLSQLARAAGGGGSMMDPGWTSFVTPVLIILGIGALATWIPSRRALRIDPSVLLKSS